MFCFSRNNDATPKKPSAGLLTDSKKTTSNVGQKILSPDVAQNRRSYASFLKRVETFSVSFFYSLIRV